MAFMDGFYGSTHYGWPFGLYGWPLWMAFMDDFHGWPLWDGFYGWPLWMVFMDGLYGMLL